jgi:hypothetical protein
MFGVLLTTSTGWISSSRKSLDTDAGMPLRAQRRNLNLEDLA